MLPRPRSVLAQDVRPAAGGQRHALAHPTLLLPEVPRYHGAIISFDAANLSPAIDDDEVEVYVFAPDKINGYGAGTVWVHGISGTLVNQR